PVLDRPPRSACVGRLPDSVGVAEVDVLGVTRIDRDGPSGAVVHVSNHSPALSTVDCLAQAVRGDRVEGLGTLRIDRNIVDLVSERHLPLLSPVGGLVKSAETPCAFVDRLRVARIDGERGARTPLLENPETLASINALVEPQIACACVDRV